MSISSSSVHFFECSLSCRLELLDWMSFLSPFVDWSALASSLNRLRVTSQSAGHQDGAWAQRSGQCYSFFAFWSLRRPAVWFFVAEGLFLLFWWIRVLFPALPNVTSGAYRYQEGCSVSAQVGAFFLSFERTASCSVCARLAFNFSSFWCGFYSNAAIKDGLYAKVWVRQTRWLTDSMTDWLTQWLTYWLTKWLDDPLTVRSLTDWLEDWLF